MFITGCLIIKGCLIILSGFIGIGIWTAGIIGAIFSLFDRDVDIKDRLLISFCIVAIAGLIGLVFIMPAIGVNNREVVTNYYRPEQVIKKSDITHIIYIKDGRAYSWSFKEASYYNSTNLWVCEEYGKNYLGTSILRDIRVVNDIH